MSLPASDGRGRYDRGRSPAERASAQREALLLGAAVALEEHGLMGLSVDRVLAHARVGRATFYAHFDDIDDLVGGVRQWALDALFDRVDTLEERRRTPLERLRALADAWTSAVLEDELVARTALSHVVGADRRRLGTRAIERLTDRLAVLMDDAARDGMAPRSIDDAAILAVSGAFVSVALALLEGQLSSGVRAAQSLTALAARAMR